MPITGEKKEKTRRRLAATGLLVLLLAYSLGSVAAQADQQPDTGLPRTLVGRLIVVDAGHGGPDPGAVGSAGQREKDIALIIAKQLAVELRKTGALVIMTREGDRILSDGSATLLTGKRRDLAHRLEIAERNKADILVSIHLNAFPGQSEYGAQTFSQHGRPEGKRLAASIQVELNRILQNSGREALEGDFYLTRMSTMPSVIVEAGFLSNAAEARLLSDPGYRSRVAHAVASGIVRYFSGDNGEKASGPKV